MHPSIKFNLKYQITKMIKNVLQNIHLWEITSYVLCIQRQTGWNNQKWSMHSFLSEWYSDVILKGFENNPFQKWHLVTGEEVLNTGAQFLNSFLRKSKRFYRSQIVSVFWASNSIKRRLHQEPGETLIHHNGKWLRLKRDSPVNTALHVVWQWDISYLFVLPSEGKTS